MLLFYIGPLIIQVYEKLCTSKTVRVQRSQRTHQPANRYRIHSRMDSLSKKIQNLGIHDIRNAARFAQNMIVQYEPYQVDIRRATNTDSWGPTPKHLEKVLRNRYQVPLYLMTEYTLKRLVDHIATRPKNLYEKARKDYVNYGSEWRVVFKCLVVVEYLLLNVGDGDELNQIRSCLTTHKHILTREAMEYRVGFSNDGKMEVHERGIKKKCENILQLLEDSQYLKKERNKNNKNQMKIRTQGASSLYNANPISGTEDVSEIIDDDEDDDDNIVDGEDLNTNSAKQRNRRRSTIEEQRRQRREILRERIKSTEQERKRQMEQQNVPDLIDFDFSDQPEPEVAENGAKVQKPVAVEADDDDDDFGDFQGGSSNKNVAHSQVKAQANDDLLDWNATPNVQAQHQNQNQKQNGANAGQKDDAFADLFSYSKSLI